MSKWPDLTKNTSFYLFFSFSSRNNPKNRATCFPILLILWIQTNVSRVFDRSTCVHVSIRQPVFTPRGPSIPAQKEITRKWQAQRKQTGAHARARVCLLCCPIVLYSLVAKQPGVFLCQLTRRTPVCPKTSSVAPGVVSLSSGRHFSSENTTGRLLAPPQHKGSSE